jgi:toxin ParE1/3/4
LSVELRWTRKALENLDHIAAYIALDNPTRASSFVGEIKEKIELLVMFPALGRPGRVAGTRELVVHDNYVVPYRVKGEVVQIIRVQHVAQLWPRQSN